MSGIVRSLQTLRTGSPDQSMSPTDCSNPQTNRCNDSRRKSCLLRSVVSGLQGMRTQSCTVEEIYRTRSAGVDRVWGWRMCSLRSRHSRSSGSGRCFLQTHREDGRMLTLITHVYPCRCCGIKAMPSAGMLCHECQQDDEDNVRRSIRFESTKEMEGNRRVKDRLRS